MECKELASLVVSEGGRLVRKRGDHHIFELKNGMLFSLPMGGSQREVSDGCMGRYRRAMRMGQPAARPEPGKPKEKKRRKSHRWLGQKEPHVSDYSKQFAVTRPAAPNEVKSLPRPRPKFKARSIGTNLGALLDAALNKKGAHDKGTDPNPQAG